KTENQERIEISSVTLSEQIIRQDADKLGKESYGYAQLECVGTTPPDETNDAHNGSENKPGRTPQQRDIHFAEVGGIEGGVCIGMAICHEERRLASKRRKPRVEVISETVGNSARTKHAEFVSELAMSWVDVIVEVHAGKAFESCIA